MTPKTEQRIILVIILVFGFMFYWFVVNVELPARNSVRIACSNQTQDLQNNLNVGGYYNITDNTTFIRTNFTINNRTYYRDPKYVKRTIKHEYCHSVQKSEQRLSNYCNQKFYFVQDEAECYLASYYPDKLYIKRYLY